MCGWRGVKQRVNKGWRAYAAYCSKHGKHGLARAAQFAYNHLVFELNTYQQKEYRHKKVVDKGFERHKKPNSAKRNANVHREHFVYGFKERGVCHNKGQKCRTHHYTCSDGTV